MLSIPCADLVQKVVGHAERGIVDIFNAARTISPCMILLDNIDILLGASTTGSRGDGSIDGRDDGRGDGSSDGRGDGSRGGTSSSGVKGLRMTRDRTRHKSIDRILSTLLVEIDGLYSHESTAAGGMDLPTVIVIATTCSMDCLDRLIILLIHYYCHHHHHHNHHHYCYHYHPHHFCYHHHHHVSPHHPHHTLQLSSSGS